MSGNRGFRRTSNTPGGYKNEPNGRIHMYDKIYVGFVKDNRDTIKMGRLKVWIPELAPNGKDEKSWYTVNYCSPFGGATRAVGNLGKESKDPEQTQHSYGFWAVPPDLENEVVVMFINGDPNRGIWVGSLYQQFMNNMVPGLASNQSYPENYADSPPPDGVNPPVKEYNKRSDDAGSDTPLRPYFKPLHDGLYNEGLYIDGVRGPSTASARRTDSYDPNSSKKLDVVALENTSGAELPPTVDKDGNLVEPTANNGDNGNKNTPIDPLAPLPDKAVGPSAPGTPGATLPPPPFNNKSSSDIQTQIVNYTTRLNQLGAKFIAAKAVTDAAETAVEDHKDTQQSGWSPAQLAAYNTRLAALTKAQVNAQAAENRLSNDLAVASHQLKTLQDALPKVQKLEREVASTPRPVAPGTPGSTPTVDPNAPEAPKAEATTDDDKNPEKGDPPALVYGLSSPQGNHLYIDDAGDGMIRLRTRNGAQIMINDAVGYIYMISRNGNSWMEISDEGIDMYSSKSVSMRAHGDINMHADGNINQYAAGTMNQAARQGATGNFNGGYNMMSDQLNLTSTGSVNIYSPVRVSISGPSVGIAATNDIGITAGGQLGLTSTGELKLFSPTKVSTNISKGPQAKVEPIKPEALKTNAGGSGSSGGGGGGGSSSGGSSGGTGTSSRGSYTIPEANARSSFAMQFFIKKGLNKMQAAAAVGNLQVESFPAIDHTAQNSIGMYGIAQWDTSRRAKFKSTYGKDIKTSSFPEQLEYVWFELNSKQYRPALNGIKAASTIEAASAAWQDHYEVAPGQRTPERVAFAKALYARDYAGVPDSAAVNKNSATPADPAATGPANPTPGLENAAQPNEPNGSTNTISGPVEAATPMPSGMNDRQLDLHEQYPPCATYTIVSRLVTHEPFALHPTSSTGPVEGSIPSSMAIDEQGDGTETGNIDSNILVPDDGKKYCVPTSGRITSRFGVNRGNHTHQGIDIAAPIGTPVVAAKDGVVSVHHDRSKSGGYGLYLTVKHDDGITTVYGHLSRAIITSGRVKQGQTIGLMGSSGHSSGSHLHFGMSTSGVGGPFFNPCKKIPKMNSGSCSAGDQ